MEDKGCWQEEEEEEEEDAQQPVVQMRRLCPLSGSLKKKKKRIKWCSSFSAPICAHLLCTFRSDLCGR